MGNQEEKLFEIRFFLTREFADAVRGGEENPAGMEALTDVLDMYDATLNCQLDEFEAYVAEADKEGHTDESVEIVRAVISNETKRKYLSRQFTIVMNGEEQFTEAEAGQLFNDLRTLEGGDIIGDGPHSPNGEVYKAFVGGGHGPHFSS